ncbi:hypothetical protein SUGI_0543340 [Cryptomeria japonica]|nr:hypothetical protein SUGI_0543340 [Cryptomeria japonica]
MISANNGLPLMAQKTFKKSRRPYEKEQLEAELKLVGEFSLRNKRELWRGTTKEDEQIWPSGRKPEEARLCPRIDRRELLGAPSPDPSSTFQIKALFKRIRKINLRFSIPYSRNGEKIGGVRFGSSSRRLGRE